MYRLNLSLAHSTSFTPSSLQRLDHLLLPPPRLKIVGLAGSKLNLPKQKLRGKRKPSRSVLSTGLTATSAWLHCSHLQLQGAHKASHCCGWTAPTPCHLGSSTCHCMDLDLTCSGQAHCSNLPPSVPTWNIMADDEALWDFGDKLCCWTFSRRHRLSWSLKNRPVSTSTISVTTA